MSTEIGINDAANLLNVSVQRVRTLCRNSELIARKLGGTWLISQESVERYGLKTAHRLAEDHPAYCTATKTKKKPIALSFFSGAMGLDLGGLVQTLKKGSLGLGAALAIGASSHAISDNGRVNSAVYGIGPNSELAIPNGLNNIGHFDGSTGFLKTCVALYGAEGNIERDGENPAIYNVAMQLTSEIFDDTTGAVKGYSFRVVNGPLVDLDKSGDFSCSGAYDVLSGNLEDYVKVTNVGEGYDGTYKLEMSTLNPDSLELKLSAVDGLVEVPRVDEVGVDILYTSFGDFDGGRLEYTLSGKPNSITLDLPTCEAEMIWPSGHSFRLPSNIEYDLGAAVKTSDGEFNLRNLGVGRHILNANCATEVGSQIILGRTYRKHILVLEDPVVAPPTFEPEPPVQEPEPPFIPPIEEEPPIVAPPEDDNGNGDEDECPQGQWLNPITGNCSDL